MEVWFHFPFLSYLCLVLLLQHALSSPSAFLPHHLMEEKLIVRPGLQQKHRSPSHLLHEVIIAIKQKNLDKLEEEVLHRSHPNSSDNDYYQHWLSYDEIGQLVRNEEGYGKVKSWIESQDPQEISIIWSSTHLEYMKVIATIKKWEELLQTQFHEYHDEHDGSRNSVGGSGCGLDLGSERGRKVYHRCQHYSIPMELHDHIQTIFNTVQAPPIMLSSQPIHYHHTEQEDGGEGGGGGGRSWQLTASSSKTVTISFLNNHYKITSNKGSSSLNQSVFQTNNEYYSPTDLTQFQSTYGLTKQSALSVGGHNISSCSIEGVSCYEGNLDLQYIMGIAQKTQTYFWWVNASSGNPFLEWILAVAEESSPPSVNSISYGAIEQTVSSSIMDQWQTEALKLTAQGVSIIVSSGDSGAPGYLSTRGCLCNYDSSSASSQWAQQSSWTGYGYFPAFPATSTWVTTVGGTQGPESQSAEIPCQSQEGGIITTGGGFSTYFPAPSYQSGVISQYFSKLSSSQQPSAGYNPSGRGYPDLSYIAVKYQTVISGSIISMYGTSCSAPVFAGMISLLNAVRIANGQSTLGFLNPTLYSVGKNTSESYRWNDMSSGHNKCCANATASKATCCASGFYSTTGWDPVTGWGTMNYTDLYKVFLGVYPPTTTTTSTSSSSSSSAVSTATIIVIVVIVIVGLTIGGVGIYYKCVCLRCLWGDGNQQQKMKSVELGSSSKSIHIPEQLDPEAGATIRSGHPARPLRSLPKKSNGNEPPSSAPPLDLDNNDIDVEVPKRGVKKSGGTSSSRSPSPSPPPLPPKPTGVGRSSSSTKYRPAQQQEEEESSFSYSNPQKFSQQSQQHSNKKNDRPTRIVTML